MEHEDFRKAREYAAWLLLVAGVIVVAVGIWQLLGLPGSSPGPTLADHGFAASGDLVGIDVTLLPVAAVLLAALGGPLGSTRQITLYAVIIQVAALGLGFIAWLISLGGGNAWFTISGVSNLVAAAAGLILTTAVLRSRSRTLPG